MGQGIEELKAFIASPSDLEDERQAILDLQVELNATFEMTDVRIRIVGWEQVSPDLGRPQQSINPMVESCDVFIGILKRRLGSPSGEAESGFIEEFELAKSRRDTGDKPAVALFFFDLPQHETDDPGQKLTRVLDFRRSIESGFTALYKRFVSTEDLVRKVERILTREMLKRSIAASVDASIQGSGGSAQKPEPVTASDGGREGPLDEARQQLASMLADLTSIVRGDSTDVMVDRDRLALLGAALNPDDHGLPTHLVNRLYQRRDELELAQGEVDTWLWTLLDDIGSNLDPAARVTPGWGALKLGPKSLAQLLVDSAKSSSGTVARGATRTLSRLELRPVQLWSVEPDGEARVTSDADRVSNWVGVLNADSGQGPAIDYLIRGLPRTEDKPVPEGTVDLLTKIVAREELDDSSRAILQGVLDLLDGNPNPLAETVILPATETELAALLVSRADKLDDKQLTRFATQSSHRHLQLASITLAMAGGSLPTGSVANLLAQGDTRVVDLIVAFTRRDPELARTYLEEVRGRESSKQAHQHVDAQLMAIAIDVETLRSQIDTDTLSNVTWEALTYAVPEECTDEARTILRTDAAELRARLSGPLEAYPTLLEHLAMDIQRAAASLLSRRTDYTDEDVNLILAHLEATATASKHVDPNVWQSVERVTTPATFAKVLDVIRRSGDAAMLRAYTAREVSPLTPAFAVIYLDSDDKALRDPARDFWLAQPDRTRDELIEALYDQSPRVRMTAFRILRPTLTQDEIMTTLNEYANAGREYWYNIIAALDETLYAPTPEAQT